MAGWCPLAEPVRGFGGFQSRLASRVAELKECFSILWLHIGSKTFFFTRETAFGGLISSEQFAAFL